MLKTVTWDQSLSVGVAAIDEDHQTLIKLLNKLVIATYAGVGKQVALEALDELEAYTRYHFTREESYLEQHRYPELARHRQEHQTLIAELAEVRRMSQGSGLEIPAFLAHWLTDHIVASDLAYGRYFAGVR